MDLSQLGAAASMIGGVFGAYVAFRKGVKNAVEATLERHNKELQSLAETRGEELADLRERMVTMENELCGVSSLYEKALQQIRHNGDEALRMRANVETLENDNRALRQRVAGLERTQRAGGS